MTIDGIVLNDRPLLWEFAKDQDLADAHVQVQYLWVQDSIQKKELSICKVRGERNLSDILTKPIGGEVFNRHLSRMHITFPDLNVGLHVCNTKQHDSSGSVRAVSFDLFVRFVCVPMTLFGLGGEGGVWINGSAGPWGVL